MLTLGIGLAKLTRRTAVRLKSGLGGPTYSDGVATTAKVLARAQGIEDHDMKAAIRAGTTDLTAGGFIDPTEIANMVAFLASPAASATNGVLLYVDGDVLMGLL